MDYPDWTPPLNEETQPPKPGFSMRLLTVLLLLCGIALLILGLSVISDSLVFLTLRAEESGEAHNYAAPSGIFDHYDDEVCVFLSLAGEKFTLVTEPITVGELLDSYGIVPDENDELNYSRETLLFNGMELDYVQIETVTVTVQEALAYRTEVHEVQTIPRGYSEVITPGEDGEVEKVISQVIADGVVREETILSERIIKPSVTCVTQTGVGGTFVGVDGVTYSYSYYVDGNATAYGGPDFSGLTYTGVQVEIGMIAVDPDTIPLKSTVYVDCAYPGISGIYRAEDTGSAIIDNIIDIYMGMDFTPMYAFGRRDVRVYVDVEAVKK